MYNKITSFLIIAVLALPVFAKNTKQPDAVEVTAAQVHMTDLYDVFNVVGQCKNDNSRDYYANVSGKLELVSLKQGDIVNKGEILLVVDKDIAITTLSNAEALLKTSSDDYNRTKTLFSKKYVSSDEFEKSRSTFENAKFNYSKALKTYNDMIITAPFTGKIGVIKPRPGDNINIGDYLFSIIEGIGSQSIYIELPESLHGQVLNDTKAIILSNNSKNDQMHYAKISSISDYLSDNGTMDAIINLQQETNIMHNSYVNVMLILNPHKSLAAPEGCIQKNNQGNFVYKISDNMVKQVYVEIGSRTNGLIEVISEEIKEGDLVVLEGVTKINDSSNIKIIDKQKE